MFFFLETTRFYYAFEIGRSSDQKICLVINMIYIRFLIVEPPINKDKNPHPSMYLLKNLFINWQKKVFLEYVRYTYMRIVNAVLFKPK